MAPPDTNLEKQKRRHAVPLIGMGLAVALVLIGFVVWLGYVAESADEPVVVEDPAAEGDN
jgi:ABC-type transporter Mla subunit MlaD